MQLKIYLSSIGHSPLTLPSHGHLLVKLAAGAPITQPLFTFAHELLRAFAAAAFCIGRGATLLRRALHSSTARGATLPTLLPSPLGTSLDAAPLPLPLLPRSLSGPVAARGRGGTASAACRRLAPLFLCSVQNWRGRAFELRILQTYAGQERKRRLQGQR